MSKPVAADDTRYSDPMTDPLSGPMLPSQTHEQNGIDPDELAKADRRSIESFATAVAEQTQSHLPDIYEVDTRFNTEFGVVMVIVSIYGPRGNTIQLGVKPVPNLPDQDTQTTPLGGSAGSTPSGDDGQSPDKATYEAVLREQAAAIGCDLAAIAVAQTMDATPDHNEAHPAS